MKFPRFSIFATTRTDKRVAKLLSDHPFLPIPSEFCFCFMCGFQAIGSGTRTGFYLDLLQVRSFHTPALRAAPVNGATMKSQSCLRAVPPSKMAGPILLAGFTEVPVIGMQTIWMSTKERPMDRPAKFPAPFSGSVVPRTTSTKMNVKTASAMKA